MEKNLTTVLKPDKDENNLLIETFDERVYLFNGMYEDIFGIKFQEQNQLPSKRGVVKLNITGTERKIYRLFSGGNRVNKDEIGLSRTSMQILGIDDNQKYDFILSKGCKFQFMWNHPNHSTRIAFRLAIWAVFIGLLSVGLTLYSIIAIS